MKHKHRHLRKSIKVILLIAVLAVSGTLGYSCISERKETAVNPSVKNTVEPEKKEDTVHSFSMFIEGDLLFMVHNTQAADQGNGTYDYSSQLDEVTEPASQYDLSFYNQEVPLAGDDLGFTAFPHFNAPQSLGDYMISRGFNVVSLANNHSLDKGSEGVDNSVAYWKAKKNVVSAGENSSQEMRDEIPVYEKNGITYAFNAWTYGMNSNVNPDDRPYLVNCYRGHEEEMLNWVREAKQKADVVIISMHWGEEYHSQPDDEQKQLAQELSDAGADIIIGNHAHNIQPIQRINDHTICFYAMGNMIAAQEILPGTTREGIYTGMAASLTVTKTDKDGTSVIEVSEPKTDLFYIWFDDMEGLYGPHVTWYKDLSTDVFPDKDAYYRSCITNVVQSMDPYVQIGL